MTGIVETDPSPGTVWKIPAPGLRMRHAKDGVDEQSQGKPGA
jgi:hypothetical protein